MGSLNLEVREKLIQISMILNIFVIIFLVSNVSAAAVEAEVSVSIEIYYESLCPYSRQYIIDQLYPTYNSDLGKYLDVELFPIALHYAPDGSGGWNFECQHGNYEGVKECYSSVYGANLYYQNSWEFRNGLEPRPFGVPWVTFNGSWKEEESNNNLRQVLCTKYLKNVPECNQNN